MSRVIKSAVMHGEPKVVDNTVFQLRDQKTLSDDVSLQENQLTMAATCAVMLEESKTKAAQILAQAKEEEEEIISRAQKQAEELLLQAKMDAEQMKNVACEEGKAKGYIVGETNGKAEAQAKMSQMVAQAAEKAEQTIKLAEMESKKSILVAESKIVELAMAIADKVIPQHFIDAPQIIFPLVKAALEKVKDQNSIVVKVSPENYSFMLMAKNELQMILDGEEPLEIVSDQMLSSDGCVIESANGNVDARLETQMAIVKKTVQEVIDNGYSN